MLLSDRGARQVQEVGGGGGGGGLCGDGNLWDSLIFQRSDIRGRGDCAWRLALDGAAEIF